MVSSGASFACTGIMRRAPAPALTGRGLTDWIGVDVYQPRPRPQWHRLSAVDREGKTATCSICGEISPVRLRASGTAECMTARRGNRNGVTDEARARRRERNRAYASLESLLRQRQRKYGWDETFTVTDYAHLLEAQGGACAICGGTDYGRSLAVDHDHRTGKVRSLLCTRCNTVLGRVDDDKKLLRAALAYLNR